MMKIIQKKCLNHCNPSPRPLVSCHARNFEINSDYVTCQDLSVTCKIVRLLKREQLSALHYIQVERSGKLTELSVLIGC